MRRSAHGFIEHLALDYRSGAWPFCCSGRGKISELMGDFAKGIKSFKKGLTEEDKAETEPAKTDPEDHRSSARARSHGDRHATGDAQGRLSRCAAATSRRIAIGEAPGRRAPLGVEAPCSKSVGASY